MTALGQKKACIRKLEFGECTEEKCPFAHDISHYEVFELYRVISEVAQLPCWLQSSRPMKKFDRLLSLYEINAPKFREMPDEGGLCITLRLLNCVLRNLVSLPPKNHRNLRTTCKKLFSDFEYLYPCKVVSKVKKYFI